MILFLYIWLSNALPKFDDELIPKGLSFTSMKELPSANKHSFPIGNIQTIQEQKYMKAREIQNSIIARKNAIKLGTKRLANLKKRLSEAPDFKTKANIQSLITGIKAMMTKSSNDITKFSAELAKLTASTPTPMKPLIAAGIAKQIARQKQAKKYYNSKYA